MFKRFNQDRAAKFIINIFIRMEHEDFDRLYVLVGPEISIDTKMREAITSRKASNSIAVFGNGGDIYKFEILISCKNVLFFFSCFGGRIGDGILVGLFYGSTVNRISFKPSPRRTD